MQKQELVVQQPYASNWTALRRIGQTAQLRYLSH